MDEIKENLELVIKYPPNKLPFIGILFESSYKAGMVNQFWVNNFGGKSYNLVIEPKSDVLLVSLTSKEMKLFYTYYVKNYDVFALKKFLSIAKHQDVNFGHVIKKNDKHFPVRTMTDLRIWVLQISRIEFYQEQSD